MISFHLSLIASVQASQMLFFFFLKTLSLLINTQHSKRGTHNMSRRRTLILESSLIFKTNVEMFSISLEYLLMQDGM